MKSLVAVLAALVTSTPALASSQPLEYAPLETKVPQIQLQLLGTYERGIIDDSAAEIVAYDPRRQNVLVTNASEKSIDVISIKRPRNPQKKFSIDLTPYGGPNSVAFSKGIIAVAVEAATKQNPGEVVFFNHRGKFLNRLTVGALPDMLTFTPDGKQLLVANEGEPDDDYVVDPEGSISIIDITKPVKNITQAAVRTADFSAFNNAQLDESIRIFGPNATVAQDLEPEYIAVSSDSTTAWVALQENNGFAIVDLQTATVTELVGLGTKSFNTIQNAIDASDKDDAINIKPWPVVGFYQPDSIAAYDYNGQTYILTANEGDARDYDGFSEETRVEDLVLDPAILAQYPNIQDEDQLGRLKTTTVNGDADQNGQVEQIHAYGGRSFSIWNAQGEIVYDSGSDFARITAATDGRIFNGGDKRSDDKGAEPEALTIGKVGDATYAFIGLERTSGVMVYDITNPNSPYFVQYINNFDPEGDPDAGTAKDVAPEGMVFIPARKSPIRKPLLVVTNEVSGTTSVYKIKQNQH